MTRSRHRAGLCHMVRSWDRSKEFLDVCAGGLRRVVTSWVNCGYICSLNMSPVQVQSSVQYVSSGTDNLLVASTSAWYFKLGCHRNGPRRHTEACA